MYCISISHKTTPLIIRQHFSFSAEEQVEFEKRVLQNNGITGCVVISTCNRSEIYFNGDKSAIQIIEGELAGYKQLDPDLIKKYLNRYAGESAVRHLFRVACGFDSMVLGEDEILRQVKDAYQLSLNKECTDTILNIIFQRAIGSAKQIKTDTRLSNTPVSIGTLAANRAGDFLAATGGSDILIIGITGKIGSIVAKNLCDKGFQNIIGTSRSHSGSNIIFPDRKLRIVEYKDRYRYLNRADVIISATTSPHYTFTCKETMNELRGGSCRKLFIDLAVPGDIDKEILKIKGMSILDIDDFEKISKDNNRIKLKELDKAELILTECLEEALKEVYFQNYHDALDSFVRLTEEKGVRKVLYRMKKSLSSEQLKAVLDSLEEISKEEPG